MTELCSLCGERPRYRTSPMCQQCRYEGSKHKCAVEGCDKMVGRQSKTCLQHRGYVTETDVTQCVECGRPITRKRTQVCAECQRNTYVLCACGCGRRRRKYDSNGHDHQYISGHNDNWVNKRPPMRECAICKKPFQPTYSRQKLCSIECRNQWTRINNKRNSAFVPVPCQVCGTIVARQESELKRGRGVVCSKKCQYILVSAKRRGQISQPKKLALQRDGFKCRVCGFDTLAECHLQCRALLTRLQVVGHSAHIRNSVTLRQLVARATSGRMFR